MPRGGILGRGRSGFGILLRVRYSDRMAIHLLEYASMTDLPTRRTRKAGMAAFGIMGGCFGAMWFAAVLVAVASAGADEVVGELRSADKVLEVRRQDIKAFTCEDVPSGLRVKGDSIYAQYPQSGVEFSAATGKLVARHTVTDGWNGGWIAQYPIPPETGEAYGIGPGLEDGRALDPAQPGLMAACRVGEWEYTAWQPTGLARRYARGREEKPGTWTHVLQLCANKSYVQRQRPDKPGERPHRFGANDGLPSNLVRRLVAYDGKPWAALVDVYDSDMKQWGQGGLAWYDAASGRWQQVDTVDGHHVRFVTLLQVVGDELWIGFREGESMAGDSVGSGRGEYADEYRPVTSRIVLARLKEGQWASWSTPPLPSPRAAYQDRSQADSSSLEVPRWLCRTGDDVLLVTTESLTGMGEVRNQHVRHVRLGGKADRWPTFDALGSVRQIVAGDVATVASFDRGVFRWDSVGGQWRLCDPESPMGSRVIGCAVSSGDDVWIALRRSRHLTIPGTASLMCYNERSGQMKRFGPADLGTSMPAVALLPQGDALWVLFRGRLGMDQQETPRYLARQAEMPKHPPAREGVACYRDGKWTFGLGDDQLREGVIQPPGGLGGFRYYDLVQLKGRLYVACGTGIYEWDDAGWRRILELSKLDGVWREVKLIADDAKTQLRLHWQQPNQGETREGVYDVADGRWRWLAKSDWGAMWLAHDEYMTGSEGLASSMPAGVKWQFVTRESQSVSMPVLRTDHAFWAFTDSAILRIARP